MLHLEHMFIQTGRDSTPLTLIGAANYFVIMEDDHKQTSVEAVGGHTLCTLPNIFIKDTDFAKVIIKYSTCLEPIS